jgi:2-oxo-4-hydroxy-4-carboxy-5-ureidoimidazoline decarboxylase
MSKVLARWNALPAADAENEILPCCGSREWAKRLVAVRPIVDQAVLLRESDAIWRGLSEQDWMEAFRSHPRIGETRAAQPVHARAADWSKEEQKGVARENDAVKAALADGNRAYEQKFGYIFIVCATGKTTAEMLAILNRRLQNDDALELREAAEQQRQITQIRLNKWLAD